MKHFILLLGFMVVGIVYTFSHREQIEPPKEVLALLYIPTEGVKKVEAIVYKKTAVVGDEVFVLAAKDMFTKGVQILTITHGHETRPSDIGQGAY